MTIARASVDLVRTYLQEIGRVPLLTHEQEITYGKVVRSLMALLDVKHQLTETLDREPTLDEWAVATDTSPPELQAAMLAGQRAKEKMVRANLRLVVSVAKKYLNRDLEMLDLIQEGSIGLQRAVEKFDPGKGYRFSTYAYWWIRQAMTRAIAEKSRTIRLPIHIHEKLNKIKKARREITQAKGRPATYLEIAETIELDVEQVRAYLDKARRPLSLDMRMGDNDDTELGSLLEDDGLSPEDYTTRASLRADIFGMLNGLTPQQRRVITLRFGLHNGPKMTLAAIGQQLDISRERVRQLEREALRRLRRQTDDIRDYLIAG